MTEVSREDPGGPRRSPRRIVEVMVGSAILLVLVAGVVWPMVRDGCLAELEVIHFAREKEAVEIYALRNGRFPTEAEGLAAALGGEVPTDPWGRPLIYRRPVRAAPRSRS